jgi:phosphoribosylglycinamide formyltransferase 1
VKNIVIFASGEGTNAQRLIDHFKGSDKVKIALVISGNPNAFVLQRAQKAAIPSLVVTKESFKSSYLVKVLKDQKTELIVLAGFLWLLPQNLLDAFPKRIINIHPALLPKYGGKGMYGMNVHSAVYSAREKETGITIHYVDEHFDNGEIILQEKCAIEESDDVKTISKKVQELEHRFFPLAVEKALSLL